MRLQILLCCLLLTYGLIAQVTASAGADNGSGYATILAAGFEIESPDCEHTSFGAHVTQVYDAELDRNVFVFHSHIDEDNDRCVTFDRVRMEIKGSPTTIPELQHQVGDTSYYRWKFRLAENFIGANSFTHLFQNKIKGGNDDSFPVLTLTARASILEFRHNGGTTGANLNTLTSASLNEFRGEWVEVYLWQVHGENGQVFLSIKDMETGLTIMEYENNDIDLWREGATISRPKFGVYRSKNDILQDEEVRFADFCVSEVSEDLCPGEAILQPDTVAPTTPVDLVVTNTTFTTISLEWETATDEFGVTGYEVHVAGNLFATTSETTASIEDLTAGTAYEVRVRATDAAGNLSEFSDVVTAITDAVTDLPDPVNNPIPANGATDVDPGIGLSWTGGDNTDEYEVFFGTEMNPPSVGMQSGTSFIPVLAENTTYFWRVASTNTNGTISSPTWTFTTGALGSDLPWYVFRANDRPEVETDFYTLNATPDMPVVDIIVDDPNGSDNTYFGFRSDSDNFRWRYALADGDSTLTIVARLKAIAPDVNGIIYFETRAFGWRQKVRINQSSIKLERTDDEVEADVPFNWNDELHLVRFVVTGAETTVYLDEDPTPFISGISNTETSSDYFEWGKSGGSDYGAFVDWVAITSDEASAPEAGTPLPEDLFLSSDATLATLQVNQTAVDTFMPYETGYTFEFFEGDPVPGLEYTTTSAFATVSEMLPTELPGVATIEVMAEDGFTSRTYTLVFDVLSGLYDPAFQDALAVYPNPATSLVTLNLPSSEAHQLTIFSPEGRRILEREVVDGQSINVNELPRGTYLMLLQSQDGKSGALRLIKK